MIKIKHSQKMSPTIQGIYRSILLQLKVLYTESEARAMADRLFEHFFDLTPIKRVSSGSVVLSDEQVNDLNKVVNKLLEYMPLQYALGKAWFMNMQFDITPDVLIPRPETEELVSLILKRYSEINFNEQLHILDIGTGSGCIAIALKYNLPRAHVTGLDISECALRVAKANAVQYNLDVDFIHADILDENHWLKLPEYDIIVSNPPYVTHAEKQYMQPNVLNFEPDIALFVPDEDPLLFYRCIFRFAKMHLLRGGTLWLEINEAFGKELKQLALDQGFKDVNIIFDIRGKNRFLQCSK